MKRYIRSQSIELLEINIDVLVESPFINPEELNQYIAAAYNADDFNIPEGPVIPRDKNRITQQMISDYESFIDDVETLCECNYDLTLILEDESENHPYYSYAVKNNYSDQIARIRFKLIALDHVAHEAACQNTQCFYKEVIVNGLKFDSYHAAFDYIEKLIHGVDYIYKVIKHA